MGGPQSHGLSLSFGQGCGADVPGAMETLATRSSGQVVPDRECGCPLEPTTSRFGRGQYSGLAWLVAAEAAMREPRRAVASRSSQRLFSPQPVGAHSGRQRTAGAIQLQGLVGESCSVSGAMLSSQEP
jgi:hypothetical protein